ncbi:MAG: lytic transglycosylase domain-containing protein [Armatimonadetes bacterium]|nr:lytic transglycosylase domain-containing protein [Armatimonadota bacterium]
MTTTKRLLLSCLSLTGFVGLLLVNPSPAYATDGADYVALRNKSSCNRQLSYTIVQANPPSYNGQVMELRGTVGGMIKGDTLAIVLNMTDQNFVNLDVPTNEAGWLQQVTNPMVRVLVKVENAGIGNAVPMKVLAISHDSEVGAIESVQAVRDREYERRMETRKRMEARSMLAKSQQRSQLGSRGGVNRDTPVTADIQKLAEYYAPKLGTRVRDCFVPYLRFVANYNRRLSMSTAALITANLLYFADRYDVDPRLAVAMIIAESGFDPMSTSRTGARGLGQLMPGTAQSLGVSNSYDPAQNLDGSIRYLRNRLDLFRDKGAPGGGIGIEQIRLAMAAYNAGAAAVKRHGGVPPFRETQAYVRRVESLYRQLSGQ